MSLVFRSLGGLELGGFVLVLGREIPMVTAWAWLALASWLCLVASASGVVKFDSGDDGGSRRIDDTGEQLLTEQQMADGIFPEDDSSPIIDRDRFYFLAPLLQQVLKFSL